MSAVRVSCAGLCIEDHFKLVLLLAGQGCALHFYGRSGTTQRRRKLSSHLGVKQHEGCNSLNVETVNRWSVFKAANALVDRPPRCAFGSLGCCVVQAANAKTISPLSRSTSDKIAYPVDRSQLEAALSTTQVFLRSLPSRDIIVMPQFNLTVLGNT